MADAAKVWAPIYVIGAGYKQLNGAYKGSGTHAGRLRYKHPNQLIWCFYDGDAGDGLWVFSNKSRHLDDMKTFYKNKHNKDVNDPIPMRGWKYLSSPGCNPSPKVVNSAFVKGEEVDIFSKKSKKWVAGVIHKVNEKGTYGCKIKGMRKPLNIPREQIRMLSDTHFTVKQFVEIKTKSDGWKLAMVGEVKENGKYYVVLPDGKGANFPEAKIRASELCRDAEDGGGATSSAPAAVASPATSLSPRGHGGSGGVDASVLAEKDARIAALEAKVAQLQSAGPKGSFDEGAARGGSKADPELVRKILEKQAQISIMVEDLQKLTAQLLIE